MKLSLRPPFIRRPRAARSHSSRRLLLECLEGRLAPAASFTATVLVDGFVANNVLTTTGSEIRLDFSSGDRGLMEFDISSLDPTVTITSATLTGDPALLQYNSNQNRVDTDFYTYPGNGSLSLADAFPTNNRYGGKLSTASLSQFSVPIAVSAIQPLLGTTNYIGIQARKVFGERIWITSLEGSSIYADAPKLTLNYTHAPVGSADAYSLNEDGTLTIAGPGVLGNDSDADGDPITAVLAGLPSNGSVALNANGSFTYIPRANFFGIDQFTYVASDGAAQSVPTTVTITVNPVADAPVAVNDSFTVVAGTGTVIVGPPPALTPLLRYGFDENVNGHGAAYVVDTGADPGADGTLVGPVGRIAQTPSGRPGGALDLTAPGVSYVDAGDAAKLDGLSAMTLTAWINLRGAPNDRDVLFSDEFLFAPAAEAGWALRIGKPFDNTNPLSAANFALTFSVQTSMGTYTNAQGAYSNALSADGEWLFVALTFNSSGQLIYYRGDEHSAASQLGGARIFEYRLGSNSVPFRIGSTAGDSSSIDFTPPAWLDDVRIYGSALTAAQVEQVRGASTIASVLANDLDPDGDNLTPVVVTGPAHGALTLNPDGTFVYTPNSGFLGTDSFTYKVNDGQSDSNIATVTLNVVASNPQNVAPVARNDTYNANVGTPLNIAAPGLQNNDTDPDSAVLTVSVQSMPANGTLTLNPNGSFTYTPNSGFVGTDSFTYKANDGTLDSNVATVWIIVGGAPTATDDTYSVNEDTTLTVNAAGVLSNDTDPNADPLRAILVSGPAHGTLTLNTNGSFTYRGEAHYNGPDSFTYKVNDGTLDGNIATVWITVNPVNDTPVGTADAYAMNENQVLTVASVAAGVLNNDSDVDGTPLTAFLYSSPTRGSLTLNANGTFTYTPLPGFNGSDSFRYRVSDGTLFSGVVVVTITISGVNDAPVAVDDTYSVNEDTTLTIASSPGVVTNDRDPEFNPITATLVSGPSHGTLTLNASGTFTYRAFANYTGPDSFTYKVNDGSLDSNVATARITVNPVNDSPSPITDEYTIDEDQSLTVSAPGVLANDLDPDGDQLTAVIYTNPWHGTVTLNPNGSFVYTPAANFSGVDAFTYNLSDGKVVTSYGTVRITVNPIPDAPLTGPDSYTMKGNRPLVVASPGVRANDSDPDGDPITVRLISGPSNGVLTFNSNGSFNYTPATGFNGTDSFVYRASDGTRESADTPVTITVSGFNAAPTANDSAFTINEDVSLSVSISTGVLANDTDPDSDALTALVVDRPTHGTLTLYADGSFFYFPAQNYYGSDQFTYKANDGALDSNIATVRITINPVNDAPTAILDTYSLDEDGTLTVNAASGILANDSDAEGNPFTATLFEGPTSGTLVFNTDGSFTYTPNPNFDGIDRFTYTASDGSATSNTGFVQLIINKRNDAPVVVDRNFTIGEDQTLTVTAPRRTSGMFVGQPGDYVSQGRTWQLDPLVRTRSSNANVVGLDWNSSSWGETSSWTTSFAAADRSTLRVGSYLNAERYPFQDPGQPGLSVSGDGRGNNALIGEFTVLDSSFDANGNVLSFAATFTQIGGPGSLSGEVYYNSAYGQNLGILRDAIDVDANPLTAIIVTGPAHGTLALNPDGTFTYTPNANYSGPDQFTYKAYDGTSDSNIATVRITVSPVNDAPTATGNSYLVNKATPLNVPVPGVLANDSDLEGDNLSATLVAGPQHGVLTWNQNGSFIYTPFANYEGPDSFTYKAYDGNAHSNLATVTLTVTNGSAATFVEADSNTRGTWKALYGRQGFNLAEDASGGTSALASLASVTWRGQAGYTWAASTTDPAALEKATGTTGDRLAATWYATNTFEIDVRINDGQTHQIALYALDWRDGTRRETVQLIDTASGSVLDSQSIANFANGVYLVWNVSGNFTIKVTRTAGPNAVLSGLFLDPETAPNTATFLATDTTTKGSWKNTYGSDGHNLAQDTTGGNPSIPAYASVTLRGQNNYTWATNTSLPAALEKSTGTPADRLAATWYAANSFEIDVRINDGQTHQIALYALDWNDGTRSQTIQLFDTVSGAQLDSRSIANFSNGVYLVWNVSGRVTIKVTRTAGPNAVLSGLFFDPETAPSTASFVKTDTTTQGAWKSQYGGDGHNLAQDTSGGNPILPAYASVTLKGKTDYTWAASTTEAAALEKSSTGTPIDRLAATWYAANSFEIDVRFDDANSHRLALYALDWHDGSRSQTIQLFDTGTGALLDTQTIANFQNGVYLVWNVTGRITIKVTKNTGPNAVLSGLFFG